MNHLTDVLVLAATGLIVVASIFGTLMFTKPARQIQQAEAANLRLILATILADLEPEQLEAVNLWAWAHKSGWSVALHGVTDYPLIAAKLRSTAPLT